MRYKSKFTNLLILNHSKLTLDRGQHNITIQMLIEILWPTRYIHIYIEYFIGLFYSEKKNKELNKNLTLKLVQFHYAYVIQQVLLKLNLFIC